MKQYFIYLNGEQAGPFTLEQLEGKNIKSDTLVWYEGLPDWQIAETIGELRPLFKTIPPPIPRATPPVFPKSKPVDTSQFSADTNQQQSESKTSSGKKILLYIATGIILLLGVSAFVSYQNDQQAKQHLMEMRIAEQERLAREARIREINNELQIVYENIEKAKRQLHDISSFHFLRSERERHKQISEAEDILASWESKKNGLEEELKKLSRID